MSVGEFWLFFCLLLGMYTLGFLVGLMWASWRFGRWLAEGEVCEPCPACQPEGEQA